MPTDDVYMPLHVGAEGKEPLGIIQETIFPRRIQITVSSQDCTGPGRIWTASILDSVITAGTLAAGCIRRI